ncbi:uncharacterized protein [Sinocyclocheilus grahami]|uniref:uncharacterized protein n=1 Tax=Sinocyclocheilus grahami TaxID=75366 RepID=UPI0007AD37D6|nr:PREDICTED: uncharacterized protein LOC107582937 [Sinocyclocheilus grahami]
MRRKTIAKRILYSGYEAYEETPEETGARANHVLSQEPAKRRKWREPNGEDISSCNADYVKFKTKAFEVDKPLGDATRDAHFTMEVLGSLQSRSRAELVAMVVSMQREMDGLREQIRSLTACGKLAQTLEELIEKSDRWLCGSHEAATPSIPRELERSRPPSHISPPRVLSGRAAECASSEQQGCGQYEVTQTMPQRNGTLPEQKVITADLLERCNTGTTARHQNEMGEATQKALTPDLVLPRLWSHGEKSSRTGREETEPSGPVLDSTVSSSEQLLPR